MTPKPMTVGELIAALVALNNASLPVGTLVSDDGVDGLFASLHGLDDYETACVLVFADAEDC